MLIPFPYLFEKYHIKSEGVLHLGAHLGQEAEAYRQCGVKRVIWIEALPSIYHRLVNKMAMFPGSTCLRACLSDKDGETVNFYMSSNEGQSSSFLKFGTHTLEHPTVTVVRTTKMVTSRVDTLLRQSQLKIGSGWFLNADLQGAELLALKGMGDLLWKFDHAYIEVNEEELYLGCPLVKEIDDYLLQYGLAGVETKMTDAGWGDKYYKRFATLK